MDTFTIHLASRNHAVLDESLTKLLGILPATSRVELLGRDGSGSQRRRVTVVTADDKLVARLARLDLPASVDLAVRTV